MSIAMPNICWCDALVMDGVPDALVLPAVPLVVPPVVPAGLFPVVSPADVPAGAAMLLALEVIAGGSVIAPALLPLASKQGQSRMYETVCVAETSMDSGAFEHLG